MRKCSALPFGTAFGDAPGVASFSCICWWGHGPLCRWSKMTTVRQAWLWGWQISRALAPYLVWRYHVLVSVVRMKQGAKQDFPRPKRNLTGSVILESFQGGLLGHSANGWSCFLCVSPLTPFKLKAIYLCFWGKVEDIILISRMVPNASFTVRCLSSSTGWWCFYPFNQQRNPWGFFCAKHHDKVTCLVLVCRHLLPRVRCSKGNKLSKESAYWLFLLPV